MEKDWRTEEMKDESLAPRVGEDHITGVEGWFPVLSPNDIQELPNALWFSDVLTLKRKEGTTLRAVATVDVSAHLLPVPAFPPWLRTVCVQGCLCCHRYRAKEEAQPYSTSS